MIYGNDYDDNRHTLNSSANRGAVMFSLNGSNVELRHAYCQEFGNTKSNCCTVQIILCLSVILFTNLVSKY